MTLNLRIGMTISLANIYRAYSQRSHHTRLAEKHSKAEPVPITTFSHDSNQFWYLPAPNNIGNHPIP